MTSPPEGGARSRAPQRSVNGILLLDKPQGLTSNGALQIVKRIYRARKAGHTGSLDPLATGVLPICLGEATKYSGFLLDADKSYQVTLRLGTTTTTADAEGAVLVERAVPSLTWREIEPVLARFTGAILQIPPMYSALKHQGQALYHLARRGIEVERAPRPVTIYALRLLDQRADAWDLAVRCSKGTYIRTLVEDIGEVLGCGAHVSALRRTAAGPFVEAELVTLDTLNVQNTQPGVPLDALLLPVEQALIGWPQVLLSEDMAFALGRGQSVPGTLSTPGYVRLYVGQADTPQRFLGVGWVGVDGMIAPKRMMSAP